MEAWLRILAIWLALVPGTTVRQTRSSESQEYETDSRIPIWLWWDYPADVRGYVAAAELALEHFAPSDQFVINKVNETNIKDLLPDWSEELGRMYVAAKTDAARAGLLGKYGGVYLDSDMLLASPMSDITNLLDTHDMVAYETQGQNCNFGTFSSNFMASRPKSELHTEWYERVKKQVLGRCTADPAPENDPVCCYSPGGKPLEQCHVPWGGLGEKIGHKVLGELLAREDKTYKPFCYTFAKKESFAPCVDCFWASIPEGRGIGKTTCELDGEDGLTCSNGRQNNFFKRKAYHLFSSNAPPHAEDLTLEELKTGPWVFSRLLKRIMPKL